MIILHRTVKIGPVAFGITEIMAHNRRMRTAKQKLLLVGVFVAAALTAIAAYSSSTGRVNETMPRLAVESKIEGKLIDNSTKEDKSREHNGTCCPK